MSRASISVLKKRIYKQKKNTIKRGEENKKRRELNRRKTSRCEGYNFDGCVKDAKKEKKTNWYDVMTWFRDGIEELYKGKNVTIPEDGLYYTAKDKANAARLLKLYGPELTKKAVEYICKNWEKMKESSNGRLTGIPNVGLLWVIRDRIFPDAEMGKEFFVKKYSDGKHSDRNYDEFHYEEKYAGHGWK